MPPVKYLILLLIAFTAHVSFAQKKEQSVDSAANRYPIPWETIRPADILWTKRIWRRIDVYERNNAVFRSHPGIPVKNVFPNILLSGIKEGAFKAYTDMDTNFLTPMTMEEVDASIRCDPDSISVYSRMYLNYIAAHPNDPINFSIGHSKENMNGYDTSNVGSCTFPQQVEYYGIKEDWIFDRNKGQMVVHIAAIAPMAEMNGKMKFLFWVRYPEIRAYIAKYEAYTGKDSKYYYTWDEYFESRQFSSKIVYVQGLDIADEKAEDAKSRRRKKHRSEWIY